MYWFYPGKMLPFISALHWARLRTWFVMCCGRSSILHYGPLIETNYLYAPTPNGQRPECVAKQKQYPPRGNLRVTQVQHQVSKFIGYWHYMCLWPFTKYIQVMTNRFKNSALYKKLSILKCNEMQIIINKFANIKKTVTCTYQAIISMNLRIFYTLSNI